MQTPEESLDEISTGDDELAVSTKEKPCRFDPATIQHALDTAGGFQSNELEIARIGMDPFLTAHRFDRPDRCFVTQETAKSGKQRATTKMPDASHRVAVDCASTAVFLDRLDFRTDWEATLR